MNTANLRRMLNEATPRPWKDAGIFYYVVSATERKDAALIVELVNSADELLAEIANLRAANDILAEYAKSTRHDYTELLYAVGKKYPDETRHETALRYIRQAEAPQNDVCKEAALDQKP